jgi:MYXO-CTERM domain-containing protein
MRIAAIVAAVLCLLVGTVWFLQGINVLPGSFMTGQTKWAIYGGLVFVIGLGLLAAGRRRRVP